MTTTPPMMKCGHAANAMRGDDPCCAICAGSRRPGAYEIDTAPPDLVRREARCSCGAIAPSSRALAFFEYRGPGMPTPQCAVGDCHFVESVHQEIVPGTGRPGVMDHAFVPRTYEYDAWYCGHAGWD